MKYPANKSELLATMDREYQTLLTQVNRYSPEEQTRPGVNGDWAIKDLLAHLVAWLELFLGWYQAGVRGEKPVTPAPGFTWGWKSLAALNQQFFLQYQSLSSAEALRLFANSHSQVVGLIKGLGEEELFTPSRYSWLGKATLEASIRANTYNHYSWATKLIQQWRINIQE